MNDAIEGTKKGIAKEALYQAMGGLGHIGGEGVSRALGKLYRSKAAQLAEGNCIKIAEKALAHFRAAGLEGEIVEIADRAGAPRLLSASGEEVSRFGFHRAVKVNGRYYDRLTGSAGATWEEYLKLWDPGHQGYLIERIPVPRNGR